MRQQSSGRLISLKKVKSALLILIRLLLFQSSKAGIPNPTPPALSPLAQKSMLTPIRLSCHSGKKPYRHLEESTETQRSAGSSGLMGAPRTVDEQLHPAFRIFFTLTCSTHNLALPHVCMHVCMNTSQVQISHLRTCKWAFFSRERASWDASWKRVMSTHCKSVVHASRGCLISQCTREV